MTGDGSVSYFFLSTIFRLGNAPAIRSPLAFYISAIATSELLEMVRVVLSRGALFKRQVEEIPPLPAFWVR